MDLSINSSTWVCFIDVYSYSQYHWCPLTLMVTEGVLVSSIKYKVFKEGSAINRRNTPGITVQIDSISWPSIKYLLKTFPKTKEVIK